MNTIFLEVLRYIMPSLITGIVAYSFFKSFLNYDSNEKKNELLVRRKKESLPIKLHAYERMLLFCERISPIKMLIRIKPVGTNANDYLQLLLGNIEQEFEHNMVQQIYISNDCWTLIVASKVAIINALKQISETSKTADELQEKILIKYTQTLSPTNTAINFIKNEVKKLL